MRHVRKAVSCAVVSALLLSACSGGSASSTVPALAPPTSDAGALHKTKHRIKASIRITIPRKRHHRRIKIHGHYVSPATQSIAIALALNSGPTQHENANLTPATNPNCSESLVSPLICTVTFSLQPGSYAASFATYDGPLSAPGGPANPPTGNMLSENDNVTFDIVAGADNQIDVALDGVAAGVTLVPAANSTLGGNVAYGFTANKCGSVGPNGEQVNVFATDADGNLILGPGAPAVTLASNDTSIVTVTATPVPSSPNLFTIAHTISKNAQGPVSLTATATNAADAGGGNQSANVDLSIAGGTSICGLLSEFAIPSGASSQPFGIASAPDGNLWFTESARSSIGKISTDGQSVTTYPSGNGTNPYNMVVGPDGNLWFSDLNDGIGTSTTAGVVTYPNTGLDSSNYVIGIAPDATAGVWIAENQGAAIAQWNTTTLTSYTLAAGQGPVGILHGADGNYWFALASAGKIGVQPSNGSAMTLYSGLTASPQYLTVGADNNYWFTERGINNYVGVMNGAGTLLKEYSVGALTLAEGITTGPDGNVWFAQQGSNQIGSITTDGTVTEHPLQANASPQQITVGPDGAIWFTECAVGYIGRIQ